jgi:hypothetical protein
MLLVGVAPKQKFVFVIDGSNLRIRGVAETFHFDNKWVKPLLGLLVDAYGMDDGIIRDTWAV